MAHLSMYGTGFGNISLTAAMTDLCAEWSRLKSIPARETASTTIIRGSSFAILNRLTNQSAEIPAVTTTGAIMKT
jgi:hypothetical protein